MSDYEPKEPYMYQPYGVQDKFHWSTGRIYGIGGLPSLMKIDGLTKQESQLLLGFIKTHPELCYRKGENHGPSR